ncbi:hypothetical protein OIU77_029950 [Salix suchowensis]|uniref:Homeobox domain-containing protein n=1 Tax=Salix suchowensis TaxID=1278906 RepID=A0ABQ9BCU7_9ROSI|nr:hypothetical protein OIU77_029950 [Salix suchowensis]
MEEDGYCNTKLGLGLGGETYVPWPQKQKEKPVVRLDLSFTLCPDQQDSMKIDCHGKAEGTRFRSEEDEECGNKKRSDRSIDNSCMYDAGRKKLRLTKDQSSYLEETFQRHPALNPAKKHALAEQLNLKPRQVEVWFQNRRARYIVCAFKSLIGVVFSLVSFRVFSFFSTDIIMIKNKKIKN